MPVASIYSAPPAAVGLLSGSPEDRIIGTGTSPRGVEAIFEYRDSQFNLRDNIDTILVTGFTTGVAVRDSREDNPGQHGQTAYEALYGARTIVMSGKIEARTIWKLRDLETGFRRLFNDISKEYPLVFRTGNTATDQMIPCKKSQEFTPGDIEWKGDRIVMPYSLTLIASNPRYVSYLREYRQILAPTSPQSITLTNLGVTGHPEIGAQLDTTFTGPFAVGTKLIDNTTGKQLIFKKAVATNQKLQLIVANDTFVDLADGSNAYSYLDPASELIELAEGDNQVDFIGTGFGATTALDIFWRHTNM